MKNTLKSEKTDRPFGVLLQTADLLQKNVKMCYQRLSLV